MFGENAVLTKNQAESLELTVNGKSVEINLQSREVVCMEDETLRDMVFTAVNKLNQVLAPTQ